MKTLYIVIFLSICTVLSSCAAPKARVHKSFVDINTPLSTDSLTIVSDLEKELGTQFKTVFEKKFKELAGNKQVEFMKYMEFIRSQYNKPDVKDSFSNRLFVFITNRGYDNGENLLLEVKYLDKHPFLVQLITYESGSPMNSDYNRGGEVLASVIVEELKTRKFL